MKNSNVPPSTQQEKTRETDDNDGNILLIFKKSQNSLEIENFKLVFILALLAANLFVFVGCLSACIFCGS